MFTTLEVPVLGVVENMTGPFGSGAGRTLGAELGVPFLGAIPFDSEIVIEGDRGVPTMAARPASATADAFDEIARAVAQALGWRHVSDPVAAIA
jgi:ATP-binding protein involved in chromosome partitioning